MRCHFVDPTFTPSEKLKLKYMLNFLSNKKTGQRFHICLTPRTELTQEEKREIIREAHGSLTSQHYGENKGVKKARELREWKGMEQEIVDFVKKCLTCKVQKGVRIKCQCEGIILDTLTNPNDTIAMDIVGPLPITPRGYEYILTLHYQT